MTKRINSIIDYLHLIKHGYIVDDIKLMRITNIIKEDDDNYSRIFTLETGKGSIKIKLASDKESKLKVKVI